MYKNTASLVNKLKLHCTLQGFGGFGRQNDHTFGTFGLPGCRTSMICSRRQHISFEPQDPAMRPELQLVLADVTHKLFSEKQSVGHKLASAYRAAFLRHLGRCNKTARYCDL